MTALTLVDIAAWSMSLMLLAFFLALLATASRG